jgi:hypothetical protein
MGTYAGPKTYFESASEMLQSIFDLFTSKDRLYLLTATKPEPVKLSIPAEVSSVVGKYSVQYNTSDFSEALEKALQIFTLFPNVNQELYLISDLYINGNAIQDSLNQGLVKYNIKMFIVNPAEGIIPDNLSIDSVALKTQIFEINKPIYLDVYLKNYNTNETKNSNVYLYQSNERIAMDQVSIPAGKNQNIELGFNPKSSGKYFLTVEIEEDDLPADNIYFINLDIPDKLNVLYVRNQANVYMKSALETLSKNSILHISQSSYNAWQAYYFQNFDVIILDDPPKLDGETLSRLYNFLDENRNLILIPGSSSTPEEINNLFQPKLGKNLISGSIIIAGNDDFYSFAPLDVKSNLFLPLFSSSENKFDSPKIYKYFKLNNSGQALLALKNGDSFVSTFSAEREKGSIFIVNSAFDPQWSNMVFKGFFIPYLYRLIYIAAQTRFDNLDALHIGDTHIFSLSNQSINKKFQMETPDEQMINLIPSQTETGLGITFSEFNEPGHYKLFQESQLQSNIAVNISSTEFKGPFLDLEKIDTDVVLLIPRKQIIDKILQSRNGSELWLFLVILAIVLLFLEIFFIKKIEGGSESISTQSGIS